MLWKKRLHKSSRYLWKHLFQRNSTFKRVRSRFEVQLEQGLRTLNEAFFHWNAKLLSLGRYILGYFRPNYQRPFRYCEWTLWVPCPCFPLFNHYFYKRLSLYIHIPNICLGLGFEYGPQRIRDFAIVCPQSVNPGERKGSIPLSLVDRPLKRLKGATRYVGPSLYYFSIYFGLFFWSTYPLCHHNKMGLTYPVVFLLTLYIGMVPINTRITAKTLFRGSKDQVPWVKVLVFSWFLVLKPKKSQFDLIFKVMKSNIGKFYFLDKDYLDQTPRSNFQVSISSQETRPIVGQG